MAESIIEAESARSAHGASVLKCVWLEGCFVSVFSTLASYPPFFNPVKRKNGKINQYGRAGEKVTGVGGNAWPASRLNPPLRSETAEKRAPRLIFEQKMLHYKARYHFFHPHPANRTRIDANAWNNGRKT
jgi:hypothetical protein